MGLSSSQGRLLMLTSRLSDIELGEIMISQRQNQLAMQSEKVAKEYNEAMSNYRIVVKVPDITGASNAGYTNEDLNYNTLSMAGYVVTNGKNQIYLKREEVDEPVLDDEGNQITDEDGNPVTEKVKKWVVPKDVNGNDLLTIDEETGTATIVGGAVNYQLLDGTKELSNADVIQNSLVNGTLFLFDTINNQTGISPLDLQTDTQLEYVLDTTDDAEAESKYEYETARISRQDNQYDLEMQQLETQHEAVLKEYDSVKKVISNNIDRTFKIFSDG